MNGPNIISDDEWLLPRDFRTSDGIDLTKFKKPASRTVEPKLRKAQSNELVDWDPRTYSVNKKPAAPPKAPAQQPTHPASDPNSRQLTSGKKSDHNPAKPDLPHSTQNKNSDWTGLPPVKSNREPDKKYQQKLTKRLPEVDPSKLKKKAQVDYIDSNKFLDAGSYEDSQLQMTLENFAKKTPGSRIPPPPAPAYQVPVETKHKIKLPPIQKSWGEDSKVSVKTSKKKSIEEIWLPKIKQPIVKKEVQIDKNWLLRDLPDESQFKTYLRKNSANRAGSLDRSLQDNSNAGQQNLDNSRNTQKESINLNREEVSVTNLDKYNPPYRKLASIVSKMDSSRHIESHPKNKLQGSPDKLSDPLAGRSASHSKQVQPVGPVASNPTHMRAADMQSYHRADAAARQAGDRQDFPDNRMQADASRGNNAHQILQNEDRFHLSQEDSGHRHTKFGARDFTEDSQGRNHSTDRNTQPLSVSILPTTRFDFHTSPINLKRVTPGPLQDQSDWEVDMFKEESDVDLKELFEQRKNRDRKVAEAALQKAKMLDKIKQIVTDGIESTANKRRRSWTSGAPVLPKSTAFVDQELATRGKPSVRRFPAERDAIKQPQTNFKNMTTEDIVQQSQGYLVQKILPTKRVTKSRFFDEEKTLSFSSEPALSIFDEMYAERVLVEIDQEIEKIKIKKRLEKELKKTKQKIVQEAENKPKPADSFEVKLEEADQRLHQQGEREIRSSVQVPRASATTEQKTAEIIPQQITIQPQKTASPSQVSSSQKNPQLGVVRDQLASKPAASNIIPVNTAIFTEDDLNDLILKTHPFPVYKPTIIQPPPPEDRLVVHPSVIEVLKLESHYLPKVYPSIPKIEPIFIVNCKPPIPCPNFSKVLECARVAYLKVKEVPVLKISTIDSISLMRSSKPEPKVLDSKDAESNLSGKQATPFVQDADSRSLVSSSPDNFRKDYTSLPSNHQSLKRDPREDNALTSEPQSIDLGDMKIEGSKRNRKENVRPASPVHQMKNPFIPGDRRDDDRSSSANNTSKGFMTRENFVQKNPDQKSQRMSRADPIPDLNRETYFLTSDRLYQPKLQPEELDDTPYFAQPHASPQERKPQPKPVSPAFELPASKQMQRMQPSLPQTQKNSANQSQSNVQSSQLSSNVQYSVRSPIRVRLSKNAFMKNKDNIHKRIPLPAHEDQSTN